jgi:hypothetical protein
VDADARIECGDWAPAARSPAKLNSSRNTASLARRCGAITLLTEEGVVFVVPQRGAYVAER